jgi:NAD(P)-dependent dehydrogenase (short-subunit alcohol dehydrogenase family)
MSKRICILTGASRGLGLAMARQLCAQGYRLLTLARQPNPELDGPGVEQWAVDLSDPAAVAARLRTWIVALPRAEVASLTLINNAAGLARLAPLGDVEADDLSAAIRVGLEAPMLLTSAFLNGSADLCAPRKVRNISSGLGRRALAGSAVYCAAKAGLDHLSRAVALEEAARPNGAKVVSLAPGVIDTDMQVQLRNADPAAFADRELFAGMKAEGRLDSPEAAATKVLAYLDRADFGNNPIGDVRDAK